MLITVDVICSFLPITLNHKAFAANQWWTIKIISEYYHNVKGDQKITGSLCLQTTSIYFYFLTNATYETGLKSSPSLIKMCCYLVGSLPFFYFSNEKPINDSYLHYRFGYANAIKTMS